MPCEKNHTGLPKAEIKALEDSQAGYWRHKCAGCAYELGRAEAGATEARLREQIRDLEAKLAKAALSAPG